MDPLRWSPARLSTEQLSLETGSVQLTTAPQVPGSFSMIRSPESPEMVGLSVSRMVMEKELLVVLPLSSVAR